MVVKGSRRISIGQTLGLRHSVRKSKVTSRLRIKERFFSVDDPKYKEAMAQMTAGMFSRISTEYYSIINSYKGDDTKEPAAFGGFKNPNNWSLDQLAPVLSILYAY